KMKPIKSCLLIVLLSGVLSSQANVKPARIFSSNMVLQKGMENPIWGWADKNESVSVSLNGKTVKTKAGKDGKWIAKLPAMEYGGPYTLSLKGKNTVELTNIMIGEVWVCSGQSNMEFQVNRAINADDEIAEANYPNIRLFTVEKKISKTPMSDLETGEWTVCSPKTIPNFSAVGYFFGRKLNQELNVAVGLINDSWGGTTAETWTSEETIKNDPDFKAKLEELQKYDFAQREVMLKEKVSQLLGGTFPKKDNGLELGYQKENFDDRNWNTINSPGYWEKQGFIGLDGIAWMRKTFQLTKEQASAGVLVSIAKIDDADVCWVNGQEVGHSGYVGDERRYKVPASALHEGTNVIALKVTDDRGDGGIWGKPEDLYVKTKDATISLAGSWKFKFTEVFKFNVDVNPNDYPTLLFNGMINPIVPLGIRGAIWYQGEANADRAKQYQRVFPNLITDWRNHWKEGDFPFYFVQLANYMAPSDQPAQSTWAELREAQTMTLKVPNTGMASAIDIGEAKDIHPKNKQDVGKRLALNALKLTYGKELEYTGPTYESMKVEGSKATISFSHSAEGLKAKNKYGYVNGFAVAGADHVFHWAKAVVTDKNTVVISSDEVKTPVAVRYGWAYNPDDLNLYNSVDLPANPFRTDTWEGITK
ncbi:MAG TPA: sialate O-acetylesterase, partial [Prolixibacteraceae bacterium]|nr:sialate O-acetylesterase [Prolixibacteraceae bacterium]